MSEDDTPDITRPDASTARSGARLDTPPQGFEVGDPRWILEADAPPAPGPLRRALRLRLPFRRPRRRTGGQPRLKKLRLALLLVPILVLGLVSFVFGMVMAVSQDLPGLENYRQYQNARNSEVLDLHGHLLGVLAQQNRILVSAEQIPPIMKHAIVAVEDRRFYTNNGVDVRGIARAFFQDVLHKHGVQGASTIPQQFVKNALQAQAHRTVFEKLREAALAYHLTRKWSKDKILTEYLNTIYFGNGAYGVESAARTYFGNDPNHLGCGTPKRLCVSELKPYEAALLAGMVSSPTGYDPTQHPAAAKRRRDLVLRDMLAQGYITRDIYGQSVNAALPPKAQIQPPHQQTPTSSTPYFMNWVRQQVVDRYGATEAFDGGLQIHTTLDLGLQRAAEQAIGNYLADPAGPSASLVAIDNATGEVRAMVGGRDANHSPFNLATQGERQPGSAFKAFVLAQALREGISPDSVWPSRMRVFTVPGTHGVEHFVVHNDESSYAGSRSLADATAYSDNSVFAAVGIQAGIEKIASTAARMGIRTPISHNLAITLGGLKVGVTPLDMAHAYETIAHAGERVDGSLGDGTGPVGIREVDAPSGQSLPDGHRRDINQTILTRVLSPSVASTETSLLQGVIGYGTGRAADIGQFEAGKTGTTSNYGDAWFVGWDSRYTVAVWVGYPDSLRAMKTEFNGSPVMGGTFPALIWHDFMLSALQLDKNQGATGATGASSSTTSSGSSVSSASPAPSNGQASGPAPSPGTSTPTRHSAPPASASPAPSHATPSPTPPGSPSPSPSPSPAPAPSAGGGGGSPPPSGGAAAPSGGTSPPH